ncbi:MAG TPA: hypothetical protein VFL59_02760 [Candidatus Nanopelagicales bacterium]|nr:hypothetical protein [Candidatus Nanopelagicales bacterium]
MTMSTARRSALVAVLAGVLVALIAACTGGAPTQRGSSTPATASAVSGRVHAIAAGAVSTAEDMVRPTVPVVGRAAGTDRPAPAGLAVLVLALALACLAYGVVVRRSARRTTSASWRTALAPRAPPALASC